MRCLATHWFSVDRPGHHVQCVLEEHAGDHEDDQGRRWRTFMRSDIRSHSPELLRAAGERGGATIANADGKTVMILSIPAEDIPCECDLCTRLASAELPVEEKWCAPWVERPPAKHADGPAWLNIAGLGGVHPDVALAFAAEIVRAVRRVEDEYTARKKKA